MQEIFIFYFLFLTTFFCQLMCVWSSNAHLFMIMTNIVLDRVRKIYKNFPQIPLPLQLGEDDDVQQLSEALGAAKTRVEGCSSFLKAALKWDIVPFPVLSYFYIGNKKTKQKWASYYKVQLFELCDTFFLTYQVRFLLSNPCVLKKIRALNKSLNYQVVYGVWIAQEWISRNSCDACYIYIFWITRSGRFDRRSL